MRRYTWLPVLVSLAVTSVGLAVLFGYAGRLADRLVEWLNGLLPGWLDFLGLLIAPALYLVATLAGVWLFGLLAALVAGPFLGDLSMEVERRELGAEPPRAPSAWASAAGAVGRELHKLAYHLPRLLLVFLVTLIPVVNAVSPFVWLVFGAWTMAVQFCDYPAENRGRPFRETVALLQRHPAAALGYGGCVSLGLAVPLVNFLLIPVAVAGGTMLWHRLQEPAAPRRPSTAS